MTDSPSAGPATAAPPDLAPLAADRLIHACDPGLLDFVDTAGLHPQDTPLGQERVLEAIDFGAGIDRGGYNLYVMGSAGVGRHHLLIDALSARAAGQAIPDDWCQVADFAKPDKPRALRLPAGFGSRLRDDMQRLVEDLLGALPVAFQSDEYRRRLQEVQEEFKQREESVAADISRRAAEQNIVLLSTPNGYTLAPSREGKVLEQSEFDALGEAEKESLQQAMDKLKEELRAALGRVPLWQRELRQRIRDLDAEVTRLTVTQLLHELEPAYQELPDVLAYLNAVSSDVVGNGGLFRAEGDGETPSSDSPRFTRYRVNLLVDNGDTSGAPVVFEDNPNYQNLVGRIEHVAHMGTLSTDFTLIRPGVLHRANGGYLVLDIDKLLMHPFAWSALKRALNGEEVRIEPVERLVGLMGTVSLEPEPIPLDLKVALVGDRTLYYLLKAYDPDFGPLFKVVADFSEDMPRHDGREMAYAQLIASLQQREGLRPLSPEGVARVIDWSARRAHDGDKLSLHLGSLVELLQEADYFAGRGAVGRIGQTQVQLAIDAQVHRVDQYRSRLHEAILQDTLLIDTEGRQLGQVNGLVLIQAGGHAFGSPIRISATARIGGGEVVDIQSETDLSGSVHSKGVMILSAYLANRYARHQPLSISASLVFEQSYGEVEGDSASLGELCALLSAIGDLSIDQSLAVTGSVNQHGQVQAIGGVNEKIEGFFDICQARGLSAKQGVIIPDSNVGDLMLRADVRDAAGQGEFHIYAASHVDQVLALLTGMRAGRPDAEGRYPADSCNGRIQLRLFEWTRLRQKYSSGGR